MTEAAREGKLTARGNPDQFHGAYANIVRGVNAILDAVITPLNVAADYVDRISKGDMPSQITDTYHGEFNTIKNNLNLLISAMSDVTHAAEEIAQGNLTVALRERSPQDQLMQALIAMVARTDAHGHRHTHHRRARCRRPASRSARLRCRCPTGPARRPPRPRKPPLRWKRWSPTSSRTPTTRSKPTRSPPSRPRTRRRAASACSKRWRR